MIEEETVARGTPALDWTVRCGDMTRGGAGHDVEQAWSAAIAAAGDLAAAAIEELAGRPVADLPVMQLVVDGAVVRLHVGLDNDGRLDRAATDAVAWDLARAG